MIYPILFSLAAAKPYNGGHPVPSPCETPILTPTPAAHVYPSHHEGKKVKNLDYSAIPTPDVAAPITTPTPTPSWSDNTKQWDSSDDGSSGNSWNADDGSQIASDSTSISDWPAQSSAPEASFAPIPSPSPFKATDSTEYNGDFQSSGAITNAGAVVLLGLLMVLN